MRSENPPASLAPWPRERRKREREAALRTAGIASLLTLEHLDSGRHEDAERQAQRVIDSLRAAGYIPGDE
jgi:hypothetical protein